MKFSKNNTSGIILLLVLISTISISSCSNMVLMNPKGQIGLEQRSLILIALSLMLIIVIPTIIMTFIFSIKYRASNTNTTYSPNWDHSNKIELIVWIILIIIVTFLAILTWKSTHALDPNKPITSSIKPIIIKVIALDWKWLFIYPKQNIASINEIAFPINVPVKFEITSDSVMNSFFIPQLGGQVYAMAGMVANLNLIANESGNYKGISSNFSGKGFSCMKFIAIATPDKVGFDTWIKKVKASPNKLVTIDAYEEITTPSECHLIEYFSSVRPDLFQYVINKFMKKT